MENTFFPETDKTFVFDGFNYINSKKIKKGIIIIHGIIGSELFLDEDNNEFKKIWPPVDIFSSPINPLDKLKFLKLDRNGVSLNKIVTAGLDSKELDKKNNFGATNAYSKIVNYFKEYYDSENAVFYNYDWRLSCKYTGELFAEFLEKFSNKYDETYIIAHSMGALVSACAMKKLNCGNKIRLISLGAPFLGSPTMMAFMLSDNIVTKNQFLSMLNIDSYFYREIILDMPSAYDLLPTKNYNFEFFHYKSEDQDGSVTSYYFSNSELEDFIKNKFNYKLYINSINFHDELDIVDFQRKYETCSVIGYDIKTPIKIKYLKKINKKSLMYEGMSESVSETKIIDDCDFEYDNDGDGTVPLISATVNKDICDCGQYYTKEKHAKLIANNDIFQFIRCKIENWNSVDKCILGYNKYCICDNKNVDNKKYYNEIDVSISPSFKHIGVYDQEGKLLKELLPYHKYEICEKNISEVEVKTSNLLMSFKANKKNTSEKYIIRIYPPKKYEVLIDGKTVGIEQEQHYIYKYICLYSH